MIDAAFMKGETIAVLGLGRTGLSAWRCLTEAGAMVLAWDDNEEVRAHAEDQGVELTPLERANFQRIPYLLLSPGIPHTYPKPHRVAENARNADTKIICDVEILALANTEARYVGITGTNGKSTCTALVTHILKRAGKTAEMGGNIGNPVLDMDHLDKDGIYVLEMSSYQLERTYSLACDVAVLLNISSDHLERHHGMPGYLRAKRRIFENQNWNQAAVVGIDDPESRLIHDDLLGKGEQVVVPISGHGTCRHGAYVEDGVLFDATLGDPVDVMDMAEAPALPGIHNAQNAAAATATCRILDISVEEIAAAMKTFPGLAHRMEKIKTLGNVTFINDSKATNVEAAKTALACTDHVYWIAGGQAKGDDFSALKPYAPHIHRAFLIGEGAQAIAKSLEDKVKSEISGTLEVAVKHAFEAAKKNGGGVVLLSPACASFDQFKDFEARGDAFRLLVEDLR